MSRWAPLLAGCSLFLAASCSPAAEQAAPPPQTAAKPEPAKPSQPPLYVALTALSPATPVLDVLPAAVRRILDEQVDSLAADQKQLLLAAEDPVVMLRPLLYLSAGGTDLRIKALLFDSPAATNELVNLAGGIEGKYDWVAVANALATAAATEVLRARAHDVSADVEHRRDDLAQIAFAAAVLSRTDIERLALDELLAKFEEPSWHLALARLDARALDAQGAKAHLQALPEELRRDGSAIVAEVAAAEVLAAAPPASGRDAVLARARRLLTLGRLDDVLTALEPLRDALPNDLGLATVQAQAESGASACPTVVAPAIVNEPLCQQAWIRLLEDHPLGYVNAAWASGKGRDAVAVEVYLGLAYVVPLMHGVTESGTAADGNWVQGAFEAIRASATDAVEISPHFSAVAALAEALGTAVSATLQQRQPGDPEAAQDRSVLLDRARKLAVSLPDDEWGQAAALGLSAMVSQHESLGPVLGKLQGHVLPRYQTTYGKLLLWDALADGDAARLDQLQKELGDIAFSRGADPLERSKWLVLWAESRAHLIADDASRATLRKIVENLSGRDVGLELRLRRALDLAGLDARAGQIAAGADALQATVDATPRRAVSSHAEQELLIAATGYLYVLRALSSEGAQRAESIDKLSKLLLDVGKAAAAPPTLQMWLALWRSHFDSVLAKEACKGNKVCERRADKLRTVNQQELDRAIGKRSAALLRRGVLPVGGVALELRYEGRGRLVPRVDVTPQFLMAHPPPF